METVFTDMQEYLEDKNELLPYLFTTVENEFPVLKENTDYCRILYNDLLDFKFPYNFSIKYRAVEEYKNVRDSLNKNLFSLLHLADSLNSINESEYYPSVRQQIMDIEARIFVENRKYSRTVANFNESLDSFPKNVIGSVKNFKRKFDLEEN